MLSKVSEVFLWKSWVEYLNSVLSNKSKIGFFWPLKVGSNLKGTINFIGDSANTKNIYIYLVDSTSWKIFSEARCFGISYFPMQTTIIIRLSTDNRANWILKSHISTCQSHSSLAHTSNPQNQKLMTIIVFFNLILVFWHLIRIFCDTLKYIP